jgi:hypothetical protein
VFNREIATHSVPLSTLFPTNDLWLYRSLKDLTIAKAPTNRDVIYRLQTRRVTCVHPEAIFTLRMRNVTAGKRAHPRTILPFTRGIFILELNFAQSYRLFFYTPNLRLISTITAAAHP